MRKRRENRDYKTHDGHAIMYGLLAAVRLNPLQISGKHLQLS